MAKRGRPQKEDSKRGQYRLRTSEKDEALLDEICRLTGQTKAEVIRDGIRIMYAYMKTKEP